MTTRRGGGPLRARARTTVVAIAALALTLPMLDAWAGHDDEQLEGTVLVSGLVASIGGAIGPDRALYVPQGGLGEVTRIDVATGATSTFASGLPMADLVNVGIGGPIDVEFIGRTAYVLVTLVGDPLFGRDDKDGIYRVNGDGSVTPIVDLGQFNRDNPPPGGSLEDPPPAGKFNYFLQNGVLYALEKSGAGLLVSDGHLNRILRVSRRGTSIVKSFGNVVPAGMATVFGQVFLAETGPIISDEEIGRITTFHPLFPNWVGTVAPGISMAVDVELGPRGQLYALSQGDFGGGPPGAPAAPNTGRLLRVNFDGSTTVLADELNLPTSLHFIGNTALVVTLAGDVLKFELERRRHKRAW